MSVGEVLSDWLWGRTKVPLPYPEYSHNSYCMASDWTSLLYNSILVSKLNLDGYLVNFLVNFQGGYLKKEKEKTLADEKLHLNNNDFWCR